MAIEHPDINKENLPELTPEEVRNGWTPESLNTYLNEREKAQREYIFGLNQAPKFSPFQNNIYNPAKWRR